MKNKNTQKPQVKQNKQSYKKSYNSEIQLVKKKILGVGVTNARKEETLEYIINSIKNYPKNYYITTPNPEMLVYASSQPSFAAILNGAEVALCDGVGLLWGAKVLGEPLTERFTGVELVEMLCEKAAKQSITIGFFGGKAGVAEMTAECLRKKYPNLQVIYASDQWNEEYLKARESDLSISRDSNSRYQKNDKINAIRHDNLSQKSIDILFVALGFPKQEEWIASHINKIPVKVMVGVGGSFDFIAGRVPRAPKFVRSLGLEWLFRLVVQPWRIKRQLALPVFVWMVIKEKIRHH